MADAASVLTVDVAAITAAVTKEALAVEQARVDGLAEADLFAEVASVEEELKKAMAALEKKKGKPAEPEPPATPTRPRRPSLPKRPPPRPSSPFSRALRSTALRSPMPSSLQTSRARPTRSCRRW